LPAGDLHFCRFLQEEILGSVRACDGLPLAP
jgi:hypothetical protein